MTLKELESQFLSELINLYPKEEIQSFFRLLVAHHLGFSKIDITLKPDFALKKSDLDFFLNALHELKQEKPIQYILGETEFYGLPFKVTPDVLIPRPETEELINWILDEVGSQEKNFKSQIPNSKTLGLKPQSSNLKPEAQNPKLSILDIGTGSGCIAIVLAKHLPNANVYALDISEKALTVAKQNAELNQVTINFVQQDITASNVILSLSKYLHNNEKFDIIVSNPPYVRDLEKGEIKKNVLANEPHLALFVEDENPLLFYDKIADLAKQQLNPNGMLFFEINQYLGKETRVLLEQKNYKNIQLRKDLFGNDRMLKARN